MKSSTEIDVDAPWRAEPWLDPLEDFQVLVNAPEVAHAVSVAQDPDEFPAEAHVILAEARIAFTDGTPEIVAVGEGFVANEARRLAARNALIVLRTQAPDLAWSLERRQQRNAKKRRQRAARRERRAAAIAG